MNKKLTYLENLVKLDCEKKSILRKIKILEKEIEIEKELIRKNKPRG